MLSSTFKLPPSLISPSSTANPVLAAKISNNTLSSEVSSSSSASSLSGSVSEFPVPPAVPRPPPSRSSSTFPEAPEGRPDSAKILPFRRSSRPVLPQIHRKVSEGEARVDVPEKSETPETYPAPVPEPRPLKVEVIVEAPAPHRVDTASTAAPLSLPWVRQIDPSLRLKEPTTEHFPLPVKTGPHLDSWTSWYRVLRLQKFLQSTNLDALVFVCGVDGDYNQAGYEILSYLLDYGNRAKNPRLSAAEALSLEEALEDFTLVLTRTGDVRIQTNPVAYREYQRFIHRWFNVQIFCQTAPNAEDMDGSELYKVCSFVEMMEGLGSVGFAFRQEEHPERWPLIQAYAVEGVGKGTFFTQLHPLQNVLAPITAIFQEIDAHSFTSLLPRVFQLESNWHAVMDLVDSGCLDAQKLVQPLQFLATTAKHGSQPDVQPNVAVQALSDGRLEFIQIHAEEKHFRCARTYVYKRSEEASSCRIMELYGAMRQYFTELVHYVSHRSLEVAQRHFASIDWNLPELRLHNFQLTAEEYHANDKEWVPLQSGSAHVKYLELRMEVLFPDETIVLLFGDSYLENLGHPEYVSNHVVLTSNIPWHCTWSNTSVADTVEATEENPHLLHDPCVQVFVNSNTIDTLAVEFFKTDLLVTGKRFGKICIHLFHPTISFYVDQNGAGQSDLLRIFFVNHHATFGHYLDLVLPIRSHLRRIFYAEILPLWQTHVPNQLILTKCPPTNPLTTRSFLEKDLAKRFRLFHQERHFVDFSRVTSPESWSSVLSKEAQCAAESRVKITVIGGAPGSGRHSLVNSIKTFKAEEMNWKILEQSMEFEGDLDTEYFQTQLKNMVFGVPTPSGRRLTNSSNKPLRVLVITPGTCSVTKMVHAIQNHPNLLVRSNLEISSVTTCISFDALFWKQLQHFPNFYANLALGWVQNVVVFGKPEHPENLLAWAMIKSCNPDATVIRASNSGKVYDEADLNRILDDSWFTHPENRAKRIISVPLHLQDINQTKMFGFGTCVIQMQVPLDRTLFLANISQVTAHDVIHTNATVRFSDGPGILWECTARGKSVVVENNPLPQPPPSPSSSNTPPLKFLSKFVFYGYKLQREQLQYVLLQCIQRAAKPKPKVTVKQRHQLNAKDIEDILREHKDDPLPDNWYFNGYAYIDMEGNKMDRRPDQEQVILRHLDQLRIASLESEDNSANVFYQQ